jgi:glycosyltransferase involved in cell wall biosynthesis
VVGEYDAQSHPVPVTVLIPAYNRPGMTRRAVLSALRQVPAPPAEVLVVDDCSTDGTGDAAREAGARVIRHPTNQGEGAARNSGLRNAAHHWVALLDSDDEWLPNHLADLWPHRHAHVLLAGAALQCGPDGNDRYVGPVVRGGLRLASPAAIATRPIMAASAVMIRRDVALRAGAFRPLSRAADLDMWVRMLEHGTGYVSPNVSVLYHLHPGQISQEATRLQIAHREVLADYAQAPWFEPRLAEEWKAVMAWDAGRAALRAGDRRAAARRLRHAVVRPLRLRALLGLLLFRFRARRRSFRIARSGAPTVAIVGGTNRLALTPGAAAGLEPVVPPGRTRLGRYVALARRPASALMAENAVDRAVARVLGMRPIAGV